MSIFKKEKIFLKLLLTSFIATFFALAMLLLFSLIASLIGASNGVVRAFSIIIRFLAVGLSTFLFVQNSKGILMGSLSGLTTGILVQLLFLAFSHTLILGLFFVNLAFCVVFGIIFGIIFVNLKNKRDYS